MKLINTNYAFAKGPSFAARLNLKNENRDLGPHDAELLRELAAGIGNDSDTIEVTVGQVHTDLEGRVDDPDYVTSYTMRAKATLGGKTTEKNMDQRTMGEKIVSPYYDLSRYLIELQQKCRVPAKIEALKGELKSAEGTLQDATAKFSIAENSIKGAKAQLEEAKAQLEEAKGRSGYDELLRIKNAALAKKEAIEKELAVLQRG